MRDINKVKENKNEVRFQKDRNKTKEIFTEENMKMRRRYN
jgi:hypothetical protein